MLVTVSLRAKSATVMLPTPTFCVLQNPSVSCNQNVNDSHFIHDPWQLAPIIQFFKQTQDTYWILGHRTWNTTSTQRAPPNLPAIRPVIVNASMDQDTRLLPLLSIESLLFGNCWLYWALTFLQSITSWSFIFSGAGIKTVLGCWLLSSNANWDIKHQIWAAMIEHLSWTHWIY